MQRKKQNVHFKMTFPSNMQQKGLITVLHVDRQAIKSLKEVQKTLLLSATQFVFESAVPCGFSDEQISLLGVSNTPTDLDPYPANANVHILICSTQDIFYVQCIQDTFKYYEDQSQTLHMAQFGEMLLLK